MWLEGGVKKVGGSMIINIGIRMSFIKDVGIYFLL